MKNSTLLILTLILVTSLALASCTAGGISNTTNLVGSSWKLVSYGSSNNPTAAVPDSTTSLIFAKDGKLTGNVGCNSFSGDYKANGSQVTFGQIVTTLMACSDPVMQQETAVLKVLSGTASFKVDSGKLVITSEDGQSMITLEQVEE